MADINDWEKVPLKSSEIDDWEKVPLKSPEIDDTTMSAPVAFGRGAIQGVSAGTGDEIGSGFWAGLDAARRFLGIKTEEETVNRQLKEQGFTGDIPTIEDKTLGSQYREFRDVSRAEDKKAQEDQGGAYLAGEIAGGVAPALLTGGSTALVQGGLKGAAIAGIKSGAKYGAATGLGMGEADLTKGEFGKAALETGTGAALGGVIGGLLPIGVEGVKGAGKLISKGTDEIIDRTGQLGTTTLESAKLASTGKSITSGKATAENVKDIAGDASIIAKTLGITERGKAKDLVTKSMSSEQKLNATQDIDDILKRIDDELPNLDAADPDAIGLKTIKTKFEKIKNDILNEGADPSVLTKSEAYKKLLKEKAVLEKIQAAGAPQAQAVDDLFNAAARIKGDWKPDILTAERIQKNFGLPDLNSSVEMLRDVAKLKITKPKMVPKLKADGSPLKNPDGTVMMELVDVPVELTRVIKKYQPEIIERDGTLMLQRGPGRISKSDVVDFRPDVVNKDINLTPQQILNIKDSIRSSTFGKGGLVGKVGADIDTILKKRLKQGISEIDDAALKADPTYQPKLPMYEEGMQKYRDIYDIEDILGVELKDLVNKESGALSPKGVDATKKITSFIEQKMQGLDPIQQMTEFNAFKERFVRAAPELGEDFLNKLASKSKLRSLQDIADKTGSVRIAGTIESLGAKGGAVAGTVARPIIWAKKQLTGNSMVEKLSKAGADKLKTLSDMHRSQGKESVANFLDELSTVTSSQKRGALLYSASMNANLREDLFGNEKEENP